VRTALDGTPRRSTYWAAVAVAGCLLATSGCGGSPAAGADPGGAGSSPRPATKETCRDVAWSPPPSLHVVQTSRELVPFSPTLLGVQTTWTGNGLTAETVAGGYVDDLTEAYDDLHVVATLPLDRDVEAEVLHGRLLGDQVLVAVWRDPTQDVPCDVHALLVTGADVHLHEEELLQGLR
jgi:hypothetical protein